MKQLLLISEPLMAFILFSSERVSMKSYTRPDWLTSVWLYLIVGFFLFCIFWIFKMMITRQPDEPNIAEIVDEIRLRKKIKREAKKKAHREEVEEEIQIESYYLDKKQQNEVSKEEAKSLMKQNYPIYNGAGEQVKSLK